MEILTTQAESGRKVQVAGEVDVSNASKLRDASDELIAEGVPSVDVDLSQVSYIDSTGIGVLVGAVHRAHDAGLSLTASNPQRNVARVLDMLGVSGELGIEA